MNIIFLDIDGVLTSTRTSWYNMDIYAINFLHWVCEKSNSKIVISSTWRTQYDYDFWKTLFLDYLHEDFRTDDLTYLAPNGLWEAKGRGSEIDEWLNKHPDIKFYLILDDDSFDINKHQKEFFIHTDTYNGLNFDNMNQIRNLLSIKDFPKEIGELYQHPNMFQYTRDKKDDTGG